MAATSYDKLRFFKFFPADDSFMGSFRNVLLPFWNNANDFLAGNQPLTFSKNHRSGVHIRRENLPDASAVPKYHRVIYALSDFLIMILSWLVKQSLRAFLFQEVQP